MLHSLVVVTAACLATACATDAGPKRPLSGKILYERHCSRCHGADGIGPAEVGAPSLADPLRMRAMSDEQIGGIIRQGRPPRMPSFDEQFLEPSRKVLIAYIRGMAESTSP